MSQEQGREPWSVQLAGYLHALQQWGLLDEHSKSMYASTVENLSAHLDLGMLLPYPPGS